MNRLCTVLQRASHYLPSHLNGVTAWTYTATLLLRSSECASMSAVLRSRTAEIGSQQKAHIQTTGTSDRRRMSD